MCKHCTTIQTHIAAIARGDHAALESLRLSLREIRAAHNYTVITRPSRARPTIADSLRAIASACWRFVGDSSQANYSVIERSISAYFGALQRANDLRKGNVLNPQGKPEPKAGPQHFTVAPDCFVFDAPRYDPAKIIETVDHAQARIRASRKSAAHFSRVAHKSRDSESRALARNVAHDFQERAANIHASLVEYVSIYR